MVHKIMQSKYRVFVESLILTLLILFIGFGYGFVFESMRADKLIKDYKNFEIDAYDLKLQNYYYQIMDSSSCSQAIEQNFIFADNLYSEGLILEKYEDAGEISDNILREKKRYVLLKTELWLNSILLKEKCGNPFDTIVYVYSQEGGKSKESEQTALSDTLKGLKKEMTNKIILIPIAGDLGLGIVDMQLRIYNISYLPSVIINEKTILQGFHNAEDIKKHLN